MRLSAMPALIRVSPSVDAVLEERLELEDGVVLAVGGLQRPRVEQAGALAQAVHRVWSRRRPSALLQVPLGVLGLARLQRQLGVVEGEAHLVDLAALRHPEQRLHRDVEAHGEGLEGGRGGLAVPALDAGEVGHRHHVVGHLALREAAGLARGPQPAAQRLTVGLRQHARQVASPWGHSAARLPKKSRIRFKRQINLGRPSPPVRRTGRAGSTNVGRRAGSTLSCRC